MPEPTSQSLIPDSNFINWIEDYNASGLSNTSIPTNSALSYAKNCNVIVSSSLQRSIDSAKALHAEKLILSDKLFIEAGLPSSHWNFLKMSPKTWTIIFRTLWFFGYSNNSESINEVKQRALFAAKKLIELAKEHQRVLFVGHGIFNRYIVKELLKLGWSGPNNPRSSYWSFGVYTNKTLV